MESPATRRSTRIQGARAFDAAATRAGAGYLASPSFVASPETSSPSGRLRARTSKVDYHSQLNPRYPELDMIDLTKTKKSSIKNDNVTSSLEHLKVEHVDALKSPLNSKRKSKRKEVWKCEIVNLEPDDDGCISNSNTAGFLDNNGITTEAVSSTETSITTPITEASKGRSRTTSDNSVPSCTESSSDPPVSSNKCQQVSECNWALANTPSKKGKINWGQNLDKAASPTCKTKLNKVLTEVNNIDLPQEFLSNSEVEMELSENLSLVKNCLEQSCISFLKSRGVNCSVKVEKLPALPSSEKGTDSPKTPSENKQHVSQATPSRSSSRLQLKQTPGQQSVVRRLESSLSEEASAEASPELPTIRKSSRVSQRKSYDVDYFDLDSENSAEPDSDVEYNSSSSDSADDEDPSDTGLGHETESRGGLGTPSKVPRIDTHTLLLTPKVAQAVSKISANDFSPRRTPDIKNVRNTPTSESYFTAEKRIRFKSELAVRKMENMKKVKEAKTGPKKPRKGNRQGIDRSLASLPLVAPNFSVTKELAKIPLESLDNCANPWQEEHAEVLEGLHADIARDFPRWIILLKEGFNIMLHGYGSKQPIYDAFSLFLEDRFLIVCINGLFPKFYPRKFLLNFIEALDLDSDIKLSGSNVHCMTEDLLNKLSGIKYTGAAVFIYAMNLDIMAARHHQMLTCMCALARIPWVHVIASSDHVNTGLGISPLENLQLNMVWLDGTTFVPYSNELVWNSNVLGGGADGNTAKSSIEHIFKSLTSNAKKAFGTLAELQLQKLKHKGKKPKSFQGVEFRELFRICRESFIAHSELVLKSLLTEFIDHKLVHYSGKGKHDDNYLIIDLDENTLEKYVESN